MKILNHYLNEVPVLHFCGKSRDYHRDIFIGAGKEAITIPEEITIITFCNKPLLSAAPLLKQLRENGIEFLNPAADLDDWSNTWKPRLVLQCIDQVKTPYVLILDSIDVVLTSAISNIMTKFLTYQKDLLFGACKADYPNLLVERIHNREALGCFNKINAGTSLGKVAATRLVYQKVVDLGLESNNFQSEQYMIRKAWEDCRDLVDFDYRCECFQTFVNTTVTLLDQDKQLWVVG